MDWWSLGVVAYEMRSNTRPFVLHSHTPLVEIKNVLNTSVHYPHYWSHEFIDLLQKVGGKENWHQLYLIFCISPLAALRASWRTDKLTTGAASDAATAAHGFPAGA